MEERPETNEQKVIEISGLLWSLALASAIGVGLVMLATRLTPAHGATPGSDKRPIFVALQTPSGESTIYRLAEGATLSHLFALAKVKPPRFVDLPCRSGDLVRLRDDNTIEMTKMEGRHLIIFGVKIALNEASVADLNAIPGIGEALATKIVEARLSRGRFTDWREVLDIPGIGSQTLEVLRTYTTL